MAEVDSKDWALVFNLTGVDQKPGEHYFGLYNRHTGILRVFYYLTEDRVPSSDANDHMWTMGFTKDLLEHVVFQYAIPYGEEVTENYRSAFGGNDAVFKTSAPSTTWNSTSAGCTGSFLTDIPSASGSG